MARMKDIPYSWTLLAFTFLFAFALGWSAGYSRPPASLLEVWCGENMGQMVDGGACMLDAGAAGIPPRYVSDVPVDARRGITRK